VIEHWRNVQRSNEGVPIIMAILVILSIFILLLIILR